MRVYVSAMSDTWRTEWPRYVRERVGPITKETADTVYARTTISASTVRRWLAKDGKPFAQPDLDTVAKFTEAYHPGKLDLGLLAAGRIKASDIDREIIAVDTPLEERSDDELVQGLAGRLAELRRLSDYAQDRFPALGSRAQGAGMGNVEDRDSSG